MKRISSRLLAASFFLVSVALAAAGPFPAPAGLVGWWKGDGTTLDSVAGNNGVNQNIGYTNGVVGQAFACDPENFSYGTYCGIDIPDQPAYALTNSLTIEGWIRKRADGGYVIFWRGDNRPGLDPYSFGSPGDGTIDFGITDANGNGASVGTRLPLNVWVHVAGTLDGSSGTMSFYTNGVLAAQTNTSIRPFGQLIAGDSPGIGIGNVNDGQNNFPFVGDIDEISLYNRALTPTEIADIFNAGSAGKSPPGTAASCAAPPANIVAWWPAEGNANDVIGTNNGSVTQGTIGYVPGKAGLAFNFNGGANRIVVPDAPALNFGAGQDFSAEVWIQANPQPGNWNGGIETIFDKRVAPDSITQLGYNFELDPNGHFSFQMADTLAAYSWHNFIASGPYLEDGQWHHLAATVVRSSTNGGNLYVDGQVVLTFDPTVCPGSLVNSGPFRIGNHADTNDNIYTYFSGNIDELSLYNRALSSNEVAAIYNAGNVGKCTATSMVPGVPAIFNFSPAAATNGSVVAIIGTNFSTAAASNVVYFGAVRANVLSSSPTSLTVIVPAGATFGPITVTVGGLIAYAPQPFLPTFAGAGQPISTASFGTSQNLTAGNGPTKVVIADIDGDGKPDLVVANTYDHTISIFQNISTNGSLSPASFAAPVVLVTPSGSQSPYYVEVADLDGDGRLDIVASDYGDNMISIFQNISTPGNLSTNSFAARLDLPTGAVPIGIAVRDLDGDGRPEIVTANSSDSTISIFQNRSTVGNIAFAPKIDIATGNSPQSVAIGDLDGDGKPDLAVADVGGFISLFRNSCTPGNISSNTFDTRVDLPAQNYSINVVISDLDGDGKPELITSAYLPQTMSVYRNLSTPGSLTTNSFAAPVDYGLAGRGHSIALGDFNGDGKPDIAEVTELDSALSVFQNIGAGSFTNTSLAARVDFATGYNAWGVAVGDLDGDGRPDIVFANNYDNTITIYQNQTPLSVPAACTPAPSGLVGWWKGEENANDSAGTNNGALSGSGATYATGEVGQAFRFDGTNGYVQIPDNVTLKPTNVTLEAWVWLDPSLPTGQGGEQIVFKQNTWTAWFEGYSLLKQTIANGDGTYSDRFQFTVSNSGDQVGINSKTVAQRGVWYHVAATYDGNQSILYVNGVAEASAVAGFALDYGTEPVFIGTSGTWPPYLSMFGGIIDEVSIYNRALAPNEIHAIYNAGSLGKCQFIAAPAITTQPISQTNLVGDTVSFSGAASGTQPLSYQWSFNNTNIIGATNSTLSLTNVQAVQAGNYAFVVTNNYGSAVSSNAVLTVVVPAVPPTITAQTPNQIVLLNSAVTFSLAVNGSAPLSFLWSRNNVLIPGATNSSYTLYNAQLSDSGSQFSCLVTNAFGSASSTNVSLKVINSTLANDLCSGAIAVTNASYTNVQSTVAATSFGDPVPDCVDGFGHGVWYQFTAPVAGLLIVDTFGSDFDTGLAIYTGSCDSPTEAACNDDFGGITSQVTLPTTAGTTYFIIAGGYGSDAGNLVLHLNHLTPPAFVIQPTNQSVVVSSNVSFNATLAGTVPMSFQWYFNNTPLVDDGRISGSTSSTLNIVNVLTNDGGNYQLVASNQIGVATSSVAILTPIILPPVITQQPASQSVLIGSNVTFTAGIGGTPPYSFQWSLNGSLLTDDGIHIIGSATASLTISNLTTADAGSYTLAVTNVSGSTNTAATLVVLVPPAITTQPVGRSVPPGLPTTFNVSASGVPAPSYQWQLNGTNLPGWTIANYIVPAAGTNDLGFYQVIASNSVGVVTSSIAQLTFGPVAAWGLNQNGQCLPPPGLSNVVAVAGSYTAGFAVRGDGTLASWGSGSETNVPASASNVVAVAPSSVSGSYALRDDGTIVGWNGISAPVLSNMVAVAAGYGFGLGLRAEGVVIGWGNPPGGAVPSGLAHVAAIAAGYSHALALRNDGTVVAWGSGVATNIPAGLAGVTAVAAGYTHSLALKTNGSVVAWGGGTGTNLPAGLTNVIAIATENFSTVQTLSLALRNNGTVVAWGDNPYGETNPPAALTNLLSVAIAAGSFHGLALVNNGSPQILQPPVGLTANTGRNVTLQATAVGAAPLSYQWLLNGTNVPGATNTSLALSNIQFANAGSYQLFVSNSVATAISLPAPVNVISNSTLKFLTQTATGVTNYQGSKISVDGITVLGNGPLTYQWFFSTTNKNYTAVPGATNDTLLLNPALAMQSGNYYVAVSNGFIQPNQTYALTSAPVNVRVMFAKAWGYLATDAPFVLTNATAVAVGNLGTGNPYGDYLALSSAGKISSWSAGQSSYGETNFSTLSNSIVTAIAAGYGDTLALKSDGTVAAFGYNSYGETNVPVAASGITAIACGDYHDLALTLYGTVIGWGQNTYSQVSQTTNAAVTNVVAIAAGGQDSVALRADGSVFTWGNYGALPGLNYPIPSTATNVIAVAAGGTHFLALRANGTVIGWGNNPFGQTTIPSSWSNIVAIAAGANHSTALRNDGTVLTVGNSYSGIFSNYVPTDLANVIAIASSGDHDLGLFGTRAPAFTVQPWSRTVFSTATSVWFSAKCSGVQPVTYQWRLNGTNLPAATNDTLTITAQRSPTGGSLLPLQSGIYQLVASNAYGVVASKYAQLSVVIPLGVALNATNLNWITYSDAQWFGETNVTHDGVSAVQSGDIGPFQETILQTTVGTNVAGSYTFWWKVSSEPDFDFLEFRINGIVQTNISGEVGWQQVAIPVAAGTNVLMWRYSKDSIYGGGSDAGWVDQFAFSPAPVIQVQPSPASQTVSMGANVSYRIVATSPTTLGYQWSQNGTGPVGGNSSLLSLNNVGRAQNGTYSVTVTNAGGSVTSSSVSLNVLVPQLLASPQVLANGTFQLLSTDANGGLLTAANLANFSAQVSTDLVNWVTLPNALSLTNGMLLLSDPPQTNSPVRFYRIFEQ